MSQWWSREDFLDYLQSDEWKRTRELKLRQTPFCKYAHEIKIISGPSRRIVKKTCIGHLEVHHKTYERLGDERLEDLEVLCAYHHREEHERAKSGI